MNNTRTRSAAIERAKQLLARRPLYLDTETTGIHHWAEIVEISIADHDGRILFDSLVRPRRPIPAEAIQIHGISNEMVSDAPTWMEIWPQVQGVLAGRTVGIYNAEFDLRLMRQTHHLSQLRWRSIGANAFCIMKLYAQYYGDWNHRFRSYRWQSLEKAAVQCNTCLENTHRAKDDALLARAVLHHIAGHSAGGG